MSSKVCWSRKRDESFLSLGRSCPYPTTWAHKAFMHFEPSSSTLSHAARSAKSYRYHRSICFYPRYVSALWVGGVAASRVDQLTQLFNPGEEQVSFSINPHTCHSLDAIFSYPQILGDGFLHWELWPTSHHVNFCLWTTPLCERHFLSDITKNIIYNFSYLFTLLLTSSDTEKALS